MKSLLSTRVLRASSQYAVNCMFSISFNPFHDDEQLDAKSNVKKDFAKGAVIEF